ncbi:trafficking protein particle complex subunit 13-like [Hibiscus syriacus]|uniref:trafficking protein particle complex subunit 13-like n=1 Tax=Hibiscus syriacus TaxID=106335 RepID=UPI001922B3F1|nr:trafficking protein particle complex subunit 13-like [Hibiscus syriacus]
MNYDELHPADSSSTGGREIFKPPILIRSGGGIHNYLYQLKLGSPDSAQMKVEGTNILGKFQITRRTNLGEPGRLQTQQILGAALPQVGAFGSTNFHLNLIATKLGIQKISGITVSDTREKKTFDPLPDVVIFVESDWYIQKLLIVKVAEENHLSND